MVLIKHSLEVLGTIFTISLSKKISKKVIILCFDELKRIEEKFTRFKIDSQLMRLNSKLFVWQTIDEEFNYLFEEAQSLNYNTEGYFDISQKNTLESFGYGPKISKNRLLHVISKKCKKNYSLKNSTNGKNSTNKIKLFKEIEIGGFGKGYALSQLKEILKKHNIKNFILNAGGDIYVDSLHEIYLESPHKNNHVFGSIFIKNSCICSSSPSRRTFNEKHHLISPKTRDSDSNLLQVYIKHDDPLICDGLSTALFVMGFEEAKQFSISKNLSVLLVSKKEVYSSLDIHYFS